MSNIIDYVKWRGDVPFSVASLNEVDALILSQLSYMDMGGLAPADFDRPIPLREVMALFQNAPDFATRSNMGAMINELSVELLQCAGASKRFGSMGVLGYRCTLDEERGQQFCAVTFLYEDGWRKKAFAAFRGTDDTIVGWKEDFNMAVMDTVPSQVTAADYLAEAMKSLRHRRFCTGGHSKGGNLAVYAAAMVEGKARERLDAVYNMDGPGFPTGRLASQQFQITVPLIKSYYPKFSIVGMIFSHAGESIVVESDAMLIMQHDPFSWGVEAKSFVTVSGLDKGSEAFHKTINTWITSVSDEDRAAFVETIFTIIEATGAKTNSELESSWFTSAPRVIKALAAIKPQTREQVMRMMQAFFPSMRLALWER